MADLIKTTTSSFRTRHFSRPAELKTHPSMPGLQGDSLCHVNNLGGVFDQERADHWLKQVARGGVLTRITIANLPLCKRCAKSAPLASTERNTP